MTNSVNYYFTNLMANLFTNKPTDESGVSFGGIGNQADFWDVTKGPILSSLYWENWYNGENASSTGFIFYENKLLGVPRFRQLRVKNGSCTVHKLFRNTISDCYDDYGYWSEDQSSYSLGISDPTNKAYRNFNTFLTIFYSDKF